MNAFLPNFSGFITRRCLQGYPFRGKDGEQQPYILHSHNSCLPGYAGPTLDSPPDLYLPDGIAYAHLSANSNAAFASFFLLPSTSYHYGISKSSFEGSFGVEGRLLCLNYGGRNQHQDKTYYFLHKRPMFTDEALGL